MQKKLERQLKLGSVALPYVSAQLRASMTGIYAAMQRLAPAERRREDPQLDRDAARLELSYYRLLRLAGNLSAADRFVNGAPLELRDHDIVALCSSLCDRAEPLFSQCGVQLHFTATPRRIVFALDSAAIERLLLNLLSNALQAMPGGGSVSVNLRTCEDGNVLLRVSDTGRGLAGKQGSELFALQLDGTADSAASGLGLGLPLCRVIAEAHGGSIILTDLPTGHGAQAVVSFPAHKQDTIALHDSAIDYLGGFDHVLVELSDALPESVFRRSSLGGDTV